MSFREKLQRSPRNAAIAAAGMVAVAVALIAYQSIDTEGKFEENSGVEMAFYTTDDGKTWFKDLASKIPPFEHEGKTAVRAVVYELNGKMFVGFLERYTPEGQKAVAQLREAVKKGPPDSRLVRIVTNSGRELKRPGDANWTVATDLAAIRSITAIKGPDGSSDGNSQATLVTP